MNMDLGFFWSGPKFWASFFQKQLHNLFWHNMGWAAFWANFFTKSSCHPSSHLTAENRPFSTKTLIARQLPPGWPDCANFLHVTYWAVVFFGHFLKFKVQRKFLAYFFLRDKLYIKFWQKMGWAIFWAIFYKLIWSHWLPPAFRQVKLHQSRWKAFNPNLISKASMDVTRPASRGPQGLT
jgi:hypothetical protein